MIALARMRSPNHSRMKNSGSDKHEQSLHGDPHVAVLLSV